MSDPTTPTPETPAPHAHVMGATCFKGCPGFDKPAPGGRGYIDRSRDEFPDVASRAPETPAGGLTTAERESAAWLWGVLGSGGLGGTTAEDEHLHAALNALARLDAAVAQARAEDRARTLRVLASQFQARGLAESAQITLDYLAALTATEDGDRP